MFNEAEGWNGMFPLLASIFFAYPNTQAAQIHWKKHTKRRKEMALQSKKEPIGEGWKSFVSSDRNNFFSYGSDEFQYLRAKGNSAQQQSKLSHAGNFFHLTAAMTGENLFRIFFIFITCVIALPLAQLTSALDALHALLFLSWYRDFSRNVGSDCWNGTGK